MFIFVLAVNKPGNFNLTQILFITSTINEKLPHVHGKVVFLLVEQFKKIPKSRQHLADDISSKITLDENLAICLSLRFRLSITTGLS